MDYRLAFGLTIIITYTRLGLLPTLISMDILIILELGIIYYKNINIQSEIWVTIMQNILGSPVWAVYSSAAWWAGGGRRHQIGVTCAEVTEC